MDSQIIWTPGVSLASLEKQVILTAFRFYRGNKTTTATALGISIRTLDSRLEEYGNTREKLEKRDADYKRNQDELLDRQRYGAKSKFNGAAIPASAQAGRRDASPDAEGGVRMESTPEATEKPPLSMPKRAEVQDVLSSKASTGGHGKRR